MERKIVNPWEFQDKSGFVQANDITNFRRILFCAGQSSVDSEGRPVNRGDMRAQIILALDNLETVLRQAGLNLSNVVRLNYYTTDLDRFFKEHAIIISRLANSNCKPASTLLCVTRLAFPELLVEIEATAVA